MYSEFAFFYDKLMNDVDYKARTDFLLSLFCRFDKKPTLLLDLACGTGGFSNELAENGISVIGVDISPEMLSLARKQSIGRGLDVLYLCQNACELDLFGTVDGAVCCMDSLNHITDYEDFALAISRVSLFLEKDRLFIFDVNTVYKHENVLSNNTFVIENEDVYCVWQNEYDKSRKTTDITLDLFKNKGDCYERFCEGFTERAYDDKEIENALTKAGLSIVAVFDEKGGPIERDSERAVYVTRKV